MLIYIELYGAEKSLSRFFFFFSFLNWLLELRKTTFFNFKKNGPAVSELFFMFFLQGLKLNRHLSVFGVSNLKHKFFLM